MAPLLRRLVIYAAVDGLILQPYGYGQQQQQQQQRGGNNGDAEEDGNATAQSPPPPVLIEYRTHRISDLPNAASTRGVVGCESLEVSGIVGKIYIIPTISTIYTRCDYIPAGANCFSFRFLG